MTDFQNLLDTGRRLNVRKTFRKCPGGLMNVFFSVNLRTVGKKYLDKECH